MLSDEQTLRVISDLQRDLAAAKEESEQRRVFLVQNGIDFKTGVRLFANQCWSCGGKIRHDAGCQAQ